VTSFVYKYFELQAVFRVRYRPPVDRYSASHGVRYRLVLHFIRFYIYYSLPAAQAVFIHRQCIVYFKGIAVSFILPHAAPKLQV
jgi:hypothetical protein